MRNPDVDIELNRQNQHKFTAVWKKWIQGKVIGFFFLLTLLISESHSMPRYTAITPDTCRIQTKTVETRVNPYGTPREQRLPHDAMPIKFPFKINGPPSSPWHIAWSFRAIVQSVPLFTLPFDVRLSRLRQLSFVSVLTRKNCNCVGLVPTEPVNWKSEWINYKTKARKRVHNFLCYPRKSPATNSCLATSNYNLSADRNRSDRIIELNRFNGSQ